MLSHDGAGRPRGLDAIFTPRRVALVGASELDGKTGTLFWRNLASFPGEVVPVTGSTATVGGQRTYPTLASVPGSIDLAVLVVPARAVPSVVRDAAAARVGAVLVISGGFAEAGADGAALQDEVVALARAGGVRVVGPNCFGVQNCDLPLNASMSTGLPAGGGGISLVTQSGAYGMAMHALAHDERMRFAKVYAAGNKADIGDAELLRYLGADAATRTVCVFAESFPDGRAFVDAAAAITQTTPVIVAKTGRTVAGARATQSHTAGLAGSDRVLRAACEQAGVLVARSGLELLDVARALECQPAPRGPRVAVITNSGGTGAELTDLLADEGLAVPELSPELQAQLRPLLPALASTRNPVDITPVWSRFAQLYPLLIERLARSGEIDAVVPILLQRAATDEQVARGVAAAVARLRGDAVPVPVYACWVAPRGSRANADLLQDDGVPCFEWPERTARAVGHATRYGAVRSRAPRVVATPGPPPGLPALPQGWLDHDTTAGILDAAGIPAAAARVCANADAAAAAAGTLGYPVVAKALHPDLLHKSDAGGVRVGLADGAAVRLAATELLALATGARVLIQRQAAGLELIVGGRRDPQFGPVVLVGLGGIFVEALDDVALALAPLDEDEVVRLLAGLRGHRLLAGTRGQPGVNLDALCRLICSVGDLLAGAPEIAELDLNPVLADATGVLAVDARIRVELISPAGNAASATPLSPAAG